MRELTPLRLSVSGPVLARGDDGFAAEVASWTQGHEPSPDVVVGVTSADDVVAALVFARDHDLPVRIQATGHGATVDITDGLLITTRRLDSVSIDPEARIATVGAGVPFGPIVAAAAEHGLAPVSGSSPTVGAVGLVLGGGLGPLARSHGYASDYAHAFEVVTADGQVVRADAGSHPDLFWALRGGKGGFGVVTSMELELVELASLYGGSLVFDTPHIETALRAWAEYTLTADPSVTTSVALVRFPDLPVIPDPMRGRTVLAVRFAFPGDDAKGVELAAPLRAAAPVLLDSLTRLPAAEIATIHGDPTDPAPTWTWGGMLSRIDDGTLDVLLAHLGPDKQVPIMAVELRHVGSARTEADVAGGSAVGGREAPYTINVIGAPNPALFDTVIPGIVRPLFDDLRPWLAPVTTVNFVAAFPDYARFRASWSPDTFDRLVAVRKEYDPSGRFPYGPGEGA